MKSTCIFAVLLLMTIAADCSAAGRCGPIGQLLRACDARPDCAPAADQPSQLNIMLTTEIVELRKQVEELQAAAETQSKQLEQATNDLAAERDKSSELQGQLTSATQRALDAEAALSKTEQKLNQTVNKSKKQLAAAKKSTDELRQANAKLKNQNGKLQSQLRESAKSLEQANQSLDAEKKQREEERRARDETAATTSPAKEEESAGDSNSDEASQQKSGGDGNKKAESK